MIHREVEETLNLGCVQVKGEHTIGPRYGKEVGDKLGSDGHPADVFAVLARIAVVGQHGGDPGSTGSTEAVDHDQQLHQVFIHRRASRLHQENIPAAHVFLDAHGDLAVREIGQIDFAGRVAKNGGYAFGKGTVGPAAEDFQLVVVHDPAKNGTRVRPAKA